MLFHKSLTSSHNGNANFTDKSSQNNAPRNLKFASYCKYDIYGNNKNSADEGNDDGDDDDDDDDDGINNSVDMAMNDSYPDDYSFGSQNSFVSVTSSAALGFEARMAALNEETECNNYNFEETDDIKEEVNGNERNTVSNNNGDINNERVNNEFKNFYFAHECEYEVSNNAFQIPSEGNDKESFKNYESEATEVMPAIKQENECHAEKIQKYEDKETLLSPIKSRDYVPCLSLAESNLEWAVKNTSCPVEQKKQNDTSAITSNDTNLCSKHHEITHHTNTCKESNMDERNDLTIRETNGVKVSTLQSLNKEVNNQNNVVHTEPETTGYATVTNAITVSPNTIQKEKEKARNLFIENNVNGVMNIDTTEEVNKILPKLSPPRFIPYPTLEYFRHIKENTAGMEQLQEISLTNSKTEEKDEKSKTNCNTSDDKNIISEKMELDGDVATGEQDISRFTNLIQMEAQSGTPHHPGIKLFIGGLRFEVIQTGRHAIAWIFEQACNVPLNVASILIHRKAKGGRHSVSPTGCASVFVTDREHVNKLLEVNQCIYCAETGIYITSTAAEMKILMSQGGIVYGADGKVRGPVHPVVVERAYSASEASSRRRSTQNNHFHANSFEFASSSSSSTSSLASPSSSFSLNLTPSFVSESGLGNNALSDQVANLPILAQSPSTSNLFSNLQDIPNTFSCLSAAINDNTTSNNNNNDNNNDIFKSNNTVNIYKETGTTEQQGSNCKELYASQCTLEMKGDLLPCNVSDIHTNEGANALLPPPPPPPPPPPFPPALSSLPIPHPSFLSPPTPSTLSQPQTAQTVPRLPPTPSLPLPLPLPLSLPQSSSSSLPLPPPLPPPPPPPAYGVAMAKPALANTFESNLTNTISPMPLMTGNNSNSCDMSNAHVDLSMMNQGNPHTDNVVSNYNSDTNNNSSINNGNNSKMLLSDSVYYNTINEMSNLNSDKYVDLINNINSGSNANGSSNLNNNNVTDAINSSTLEQSSSHRFDINQVISLAALRQLLATNPAAASALLAQTVNPVNGLNSTDAASSLLLQNKLALINSSTLTPNRLCELGVTPSTNQVHNLEQEKALLLAREKLMALKRQELLQLEQQQQERQRQLLLCLQQQQQQQQQQELQEKQVALPQASQQVRPVFNVKGQIRFYAYPTESILMATYNKASEVSIPFQLTYFFISGLAPRMSGVAVCWLLSLLGISVTPRQVHLLPHASMEKNNGNFASYSMNQEINLQALGQANESRVANGGTEVASSQMCAEVELTESVAKVILSYSDRVLCTLQGIYVASSTADLTTLLTHEPSFVNLSPFHVERRETQLSSLNEPQQRLYNVISTSSNSTIFHNNNNSNSNNNNNNYSHVTPTSMTSTYALTNETNLNFNRSKNINAFNLPQAATNYTNIDRLGELNCNNIMSHITNTNTNTNVNNNKTFSLLSASVTSNNSTLVAPISSANTSQILPSASSSSSAAAFLPNAPPPPPPPVYSVHNTPIQTYNPNHNSNMANNNNVNANNHFNTSLTGTIIKDNAYMSLQPQPQPQPLSSSSLSNINQPFPLKQSIISSMTTSRPASVQSEEFSPLTTELLQQIGGNYLRGGYQSSVKQAISAYTASTCSTPIIASTPVTGNNIANHSNRDVDLSMSAIKNNSFNANTLLSQTNNVVNALSDTNPPPPPYSQCSSFANAATNNRKIE